MGKGRNKDYQLEYILDMLTEYSKGNFNVRATLTNDDTELNSILSGLNMLGEELDFYRKESEEHHYFLQKILSNVNEVVYARTVSHDNVALSPYTFVSERAINIIGLDAAALYQAPDKWLSVLHTDDVTGYLHALDVVMTGQEMVCTYRVANKGEYCWIEDRMVAVKNSAGNVTNIYGAARDITEKQKITIALEEKNELISRLITSSDQVFYVIKIDPENSFKNTCSFLSWQIEKIQGSTVQEIKDNPLCWLQAIHPDDLEQVKADNRFMFSKKQPVTRTYRIKHARTHEYVWIEDYIVPIEDKNGNVREFYGSARDITARKTMELERENLILELSKRHEDLMQFSHIVSHNLRSPLASILGLSHLLQEMKGKDYQTTSAYILQAAEALDEVLHDINKILSYRKNLHEHKETFSLSAVVQSVCLNLKHEIEESGAQVNTYIHPAADNITSIKSYIHSAIYNLVSNGIKYRAENRPLIINICAQYVNNNLVISVTDNGIGIDLDAHSHRLFMLYSRINIDREGKGLGLYMTKVQIESLNGRLTVKSVAGEGTTFSIIL